MRQIRSIRVAIALATLTAVALLAGCAGEVVEVPSSAAPPTSPAAIDEPSGGADRTDRTGDRPDETSAEPSGGGTSGGTAGGAAGGTAGGTAGQPGATQAKATAAFFMRTEIGMRAPVARSFRSTGARTGEVTVYPGQAGEGGQPLPGLTTIVSVRRRPGGWEVTGTRTAGIVVTAPTFGARVTSPVRVTGRAHTFEGNVEVVVTDNRNGKDRTLGTGFVTGGGDRLRPFSGSVTFSRSETTTGWVIFRARSAADGQVIQATAVRVRLRD